MQEPEIDNGRPDGVLAEGPDGLSLPDLSDLMQAGVCKTGRQMEISPHKLPQDYLEQFQNLR